jgi:hypothetical protein
MLQYNTAFLKKNNKIITCFMIYFKYFIFNRKEYIMIIIIAYFVISIPILAVFFFIFYKSFLSIKLLLTKNQLAPDLLEKYLVHDKSTPETSIIHHSDDEESEDIAVVISTAVSIYYANQQ